MLKDKGVIQRYIIENRLNIFILMSLLVIGSILGSICSVCIDNKSAEVLLDYINNANKLVVNDEYKIDNYGIIKATVIKTVIYFSCVLILGCTIIFSPLIYLIAIHKGFSIGICMSLLLMLLGKVKGNIYALIGLFLPNVILIISLIVVSVMWLNFGKDILKNRDLYGIKGKIYGNVIKTVLILCLTLMILIPIELTCSNVLIEYIKII